MDFLIGFGFALGLIVLVGAHFLPTKSDPYVSTGFDEHGPYRRRRDGTKERP